VVVPADAFNITFMVLSRFALSYAEAPTMLSRASALSTLAGIGVYDKDPALVVQHWTHPEVGLTPGLRDVAAMYAMINTSVALRYDALGDIRSGRLRVAAGTRDVMLWQLTRNDPSTRASIAHAATQSTAAALKRSDQDGFKERPLTPAAALTWQPTQPGFAPALDPGWGGLAHYLPEAQFCRAGAPVTDQLGQAKAVLELSKSLTEDQKAAARFWDDERLRTTTPVGHWQNIATTEFTKRLELGQVSVEQAVRTLARLHLSMADTLIAVWRDKYAYGTARPITVLAEVEPGWNSYLGNPPFPAYPSGHAAVSALGAELLTDAFGEQAFTDNGAFENPSGMRVFNISPRSFPSYRAAGVEGGLSRIWGGIHVMDDYDGGRRVGECVAGLWDERATSNP
jgi:membrane-associated phospholipid phosphatase